MILRINYILNKNKDLLNKINVFPISDKDTGRNLSTTLSCIDNIDYITLKQYIEEVSKQLPLIARGSSGNILALYILGLNQNYSDNLTEICTKASEFTWNNMYEPVEGTILTAIKDVPKTYKNYKDFVYQFIQNTYTNLFNGPDILPVLKENNTLDSGTLGFLYILCGIYYELTGKDLSPKLDIDVKFNKINCSDKYCIEICLDCVSNEIKQELQNKGSELIFMMSEQNTKIHIHSNNYEYIFNIVKKYGKILDYKIEDMTNNNERIFI